jgi:hypothetical protein
MISTKNIADTLVDASYQTAISVIGKKVANFINEGHLVHLGSSYTIHEDGNNKIITILIVYRQPNPVKNGVRTEFS